MRRHVHTFAAAFSGVVSIGGTVIELNAQAGDSLWIGAAGNVTARRTAGGFALEMDRMDDLREADAEILRHLKLGE